MGGAGSRWRRDAVWTCSCWRTGRSGSICASCKPRYLACCRGGTHGALPARHGAAMNILCIDQYAELGGAQRMLLELLPSFTARGWNPNVAVPDENGNLIEKVRELGYGSGSFQIGRFTKIQKTRAEML